MDEEAHRALRSISSTVQTDLKAGIDQEDIQREIKDAFRKQSIREELRRQDLSVENVEAEAHEIAKRLSSTVLMEQLDELQQRDIESHILKEFRRQSRK